MEGFEEEYKRQSFSRLARSIQNGSTLNMGNGFTVEVVQYPSVYPW